MIYDRCPRCGSPNKERLSKCEVCEETLRTKRFSMTKDKIKYVHVLALKQKGLTQEEYKLRLKAVDVTTCKQLKRKTYYEFVNGLRALPDAPTSRRQ